MVQLIANSVKQTEIMILLFKTRGANADQIIRGLYGTISPTNKTNAYELLKKLEVKKFIKYSTYKISKRTRRFYYLSKQGLEKLYEDYDIEEKQRGMGLYGDWGHFNYNLYKPPLGNMPHYLMCVDMMIDVYQMISQYPNLKIDFANNLYAATKIVKPDFMIANGDSQYFVEVDRLNERGEHLPKKFACYNKYFKTLTDKNKKLPRVIYFIIPNPSKPKKGEFDAHQQIRYKKVVEAFFKECKEYADQVDLCFVTRDEFKEVLQHDFFPRSHSYLLKYFEEDYIKLSNTMQPYSLKEYEGVILINDNEKTHYLYCEINVQRTKKWFTMIKLQDKCSIKKKTDNKEFLVFEDVIHQPTVIIFTQKQNLISPLKNEFANFKIQFVK